MKKMCKILLHFSSIGYVNLIFYLEKIKTFKNTELRYLARRFKNQCEITFRQFARLSGVVLVLGMIKTVSF